MSYTAPLGNAVNFSFYGASSYTAPVGNAVDFSWAEIGAQINGQGAYALSGSASGTFPNIIFAGGAYALSGQSECASNPALVGGGQYQPSGFAYDLIHLADGSGTYALSGTATATFTAPSYTATMGGRYQLSGHAWGSVVWTSEGGGKYKLSGSGVANPGSVIAGGNTYRMSGAAVLKQARLTAGAGRYQLAGNSAGYHGIAGHGGGLYALSGSAALATKAVQSLFAGGAYRLRGSCVANTLDRPLEDTTIFTISKQRVIHVVV